MHTTFQSHMQLGSAISAVYYCCPLSCPQQFTLVGRGRHSSLRPFLNAFCSTSLSFIELDLVPLGRVLSC